MRKRLASPVLAAAALAIGAGPAAAHGGDTALVHSCIGDGGNVKIIAADGSCKKNEVALDWARDGGAGGGTTYTAGEGLTLSPANVFSVADVPWGSLDGVPAGFADGVDDEGPALTWGNLPGIPDDLLNGDDDGTAKVNELRSDLANSDGTPNQDHDPVSFTRIKDLTSAGDGRITGEYIRNGSLTGSDLAERTIPGDRIATGSIDSDHLAPGVLDRSWATLPVDPPAIAPGARVAVPVQNLFGLDWGPNDIVTVSPPAGLEPYLVYAGSDVLDDGTLVVYLHNLNLVDPNPADGTQRDWKVRWLKVGG